MKKVKIGLGVLVIIVLIGLLLFASTHKYEDSHLRKDGVRVKLPEDSLVVEDCNYKDLTYCEKKIKVNDEEETLAFEYINFKENGYPNAIRATINGKEFYYADNLNIENNGTSDYKVFLNFHVIDKYIIFTITEGSYNHLTTLYAMDKDGNFILNEKEIDSDNMILDDTTEDFIKYDDNTIRVYASRITGDVNYKDGSVCDAPSKDIVEAYYIYTYKNGKFTKKQSEVKTASEYITDTKITCANKN